MSRIEPYPVQRQVAQAAWLVVCVFLLLGLEVAFTGWNVLFPGAFLATFFVTVACNWPIGLVCGIAVGLCLEIILGRHGTLLPAIPLIAWLAHLWRTLGDRVLILNQAIPGAAIGLAYSLLVISLENGQFIPPALHLDLPTALWHLLKSTVVGAMALPLLVAVLDFVADRIEINQYHRRAPGMRRQP